jgi:hypothetical protein
MMPAYDPADDDVVPGKPATEPAPNAGKIAKWKSEMARLRAAPDATLPIGWDEGQITPPVADAFQRAGLGVIEGVRGSKTVRAVPLP